MSIQVNTLFNNLVSQVDSYKSELLNTDSQDFAKYLNNNYEAIDGNKDSQLSKEEVTQAVQKESKNPELQKILDNKSLESMLSNIDTNNNGSLSKSEVNPNGNLGGIFKSALGEYQGTKNLGLAAQNLVQKLGQNYYANPALTSFAQTAVNYVL